MLTLLAVDLKTFLTRLRDQTGQGLAEYALILAFIAVVAVLALTLLGGDISSLLNQGRQRPLDQTRRSHQSRDEPEARPASPPGGLLSFLLEGVVTRLGSLGMRTRTPPASARQACASASNAPPRVPRKAGAT